MLDIKKIRENPEEVIEKLTPRGVSKKEIKDVWNADEEILTYAQNLDLQRHKLNVASKEKNVEEGRRAKVEIKKLEKHLKKATDFFQKKFHLLPNIPTDDVLKEGGKKDKTLRKWGDVPKFKFQPKDHLELGEKLDIIDIKTAAKVTGARFGYLKREAALLEFALVQHAFEVLTSREIIKKIADSVEKKYSDNLFVPVVPPVMIRPEVYKKMARLTEEDKNERYHFPKDDLYLVGSAEHTLGPLHMAETLKEKDLPLRYVGFSTCFRREAGSYGKDTKGILRVHQFDKIEMESFTVPEDSIKEQNFFIAIQEHLMQSLKIPYQVVLVSFEEMGSPDARQIDIEAWLPGQNKYRETHTADLTTDYQSRRLETRVQRSNNKKEFVHINDATAFAIGRTLIAIIENYQQEDGSIKIPEVLQKYMGGLKTIKRS